MKRFWINVTDEEGVVQGRFPVYANDVDLRNPQTRQLHAIGREVVEQLPPKYFDNGEVNSGANATQSAR